MGETFNKREKEKKRLQKKQDKEARKQERKAHSLSGRPLQDMLVYVDENGNFSETPPAHGHLREPRRENAGTGRPVYRNQSNTPPIK